MPYQYIKLSYEKKVAILKLNAPEVLNATSRAMMEEFSAAISAVSEKEGVRCLLITGEGRAFCAGANLQAREAERDLPAQGSLLETHYAPVMNKLKNLEFPLVTAVNGPAVGVGMSFAIIGDMVIAAKSAYFMQAFARIGLVPDGGATWMLPRMIGWSRAIELSLLAERLPAEKAEQWGLVNRVVEDDELMPEALAIAHRVANGPKSLGLIRKAYWESLENDFNKQFQLEANLQNIAQNTWDNREGIKAFLEKRDPKFEGR